METIEQPNKRYSNASLEALLRVEHETLLGQIRLSAENLGRKGLPRLIGDSIDSYFETFHHGYQGLLDTVNAELQFQVTCFQVVESDFLANEEIRELEINASNAKQALIPTMVAINNIKAPQRRYLPLLVRLGIAVIASLDALLNIRYFELLGYSYIESLGMGVLFAGVLAVFAHLVTRIISLGKTVWQKRLIAFALFSCLTLVFYYMASLRADDLNANGSGIRYTALPFVVISMFLFSVGIFAYHCLMPSKAEKEAIRLYNDLLARKQKGETAIAEIEARVVSVRKSKSSFRVSNSSIVLYGNMLERRVITYARTAFATFKAENLRHRTDGKPDCFDDGYPFPFTRYFDSID